MVILCPACSDPQLPMAIGIEPDTRSCYCQSCQRRYWVETLTVSQTSEKRIDSKWAEYLVKGVNDVGRQIQEAFIAQARLPIRETGTLTIVKRGRAIVGIADQNNNAWVTLQPRPQPKSPWQSLFPFLAVISTALIALLLADYLSLIKEVTEKYGLAQLMIVLVTVSIILLAPLLVRVIQITRGKDDLV